VTLYPLTQCKSIGGVFVVPESIGGESLITQPIMQGSAVVGSRRVSDSPQRRTTDVLRRRTTDGLRRRSNDVPEGTGFDPGNGPG
jgi:hypothetical protein